MNAEILAPLTSLEARLNALLASITSTPTASGAPAAAVSLLEADDALTSALQTLRTHQENYSKILRLRAEALSLEERVRETVRQVGELGDEISAAAGDDDDDSDEDSDDEAGGDIEMSEKGKDATRKNEVDYRLLLGFARRISKYNNEAAADASSARVLSKEPTGGDTAADTNGEVAKEDGIASGHGQTTGVGIAALPQDTVSWLDETANWTRLMSALPYPSEDRIRMGLMAHLHATAAAEGKDVEKEVEHILKAATQKDISKQETQPAGQGDQPQPDSDPGAGHPAGSGTAAINHQAGNSASHTAEPPKVKPKLDLDLYDPDDDDM
ncbi:TPA_exp: Uncharacterized protein A8136_3074 [Trichophyton benhamiae CBS 112371]|uniref:Mediator of RNA polymerase II transcription subunit 4 n=1 Tax=Arthroderma benhamiae (strain ATCC MYA-4681 / CBS 112371) TaxID=663331 RepID=D4AZA0_ARTBC|nr:uncharacterized protein ARB_01520 [Trichophyton benhamiae CBS 112371]EFE31620.1 conserved hypothetical protein [Trichophyton benhamiae CBS 112371]DAA74758.1 TPA_exp: Uncharacterized protein A8136_3074 [Trichophyton benhamiae CBS 112371]